MPHSMLGLALVATLAGGCLIHPAGPRPGAVKTGAQLAIVNDVKTWTTQYQEKTGETEVRNADGELIATEEHYRERTQVHKKRVWYPVQGRNQISDEDLFEFAGDRASLEATRDMRSRGRTYTIAGFGGMLVGMAGMIGARFVASNTNLMIGMYIGGASFGLAGLYGFYVGREMQSPDTHAVDRSVAEMAAQRYNAGLGRGASIPVVGGSF